LASFLVKICGVTTADDAALAAGAGADAIGVNLWPGSKRFVGDAAAARRVLDAVPAGILKVGVFVNAAAGEVARALAELGLDRAQLHGDERAADFRELPSGALIRALRIRDAGSFDDVGGWGAPLFLYDAFVEGFGGGGVAAPWPLIARAAVRPFLLAGGLTPDNVGAAIAATRPDGVDVASGVERAPGRKDPAKIVAFIAAARAAAARMPRPAASTVSSPSQSPAPPPAKDPADPR
jgi:phosphoribosylanthranilate isomerase